MTVVYEVYNCPDNPLFDGLELDEGFYQELDEFTPADWNKRNRWWTWEAPRWKDRWPNPPPKAGGLVRRFNDFPKAFLLPVFSQRAVDCLRDLLEPNGELLPVQHDLGIYYLYNCTALVNCLDLEKSICDTYKDGQISSIKQYAFQEEKVRNLSFFRLRPQPARLFCTQVVVERVQKYGLMGFVFVKLWSSEEGPNGEYMEAWHQALRAAEKIKIDEGPPLHVKANTVVLRLHTAKKKASKSELALVNRIMDEIDQLLYDPDGGAESMYGRTEGHDVVPHEVRIFLSCPDCDRMVEKLLPYVRSLPWPGPYQMLKRYGEFVDEEAREEYVRLEF